MNDFFGIPMDYILVVLLALLALVMASVAWVRQREPILFEIGVRNIPRRRAQSALIVLGLMLSTVIFAAALTTGDTVTYSITQDTFDKLGRVDIIVQARSNSRTVSYEDEQIAPVGLVENEDIDNLVAEFNGSPDVDGLLPVIRFPAPTSPYFPDGREVDTEPQMVVMAIDPQRVRGFEQDILSLDGRQFDVSSLQPGQAVANASAAAKLGLQPGSLLDIWVGSVPRTVSVVGIVQDRYITGWTLEDPEGILVSLNTVPILFDQPAGQLAGVSFVAISLTGGVRDTLGRSDEVTQQSIDALQTSRLQVSPIKADRIESAENEGAQLAAIFVVLGLFTIAAGMLLIFLILVMLAAERRAEQGMARAVGMKRSQLIQAFMAEGIAYSLGAALVGALVGVVISIGMAEAMRYIFESTDVDITFHVEWRSLVIAYALGVVLTYAVVVIAAWNVSRISIVAAIRDLDEPPARGTGLISMLGGGAVVAAGVGLFAGGRMVEEPYLAGAGISVALLGLAFLGRGLGLPERPAFTAISLAVIVLWILIAGGNLTVITGDGGGSGLETFFVGGVLMVAGATFAIIYNADILLGGVRAVGLLFARAAPAVRTAVAYPLSSRFRTGMTIAMLSLVVFALVMISTLSTNFRELFLDPASRGGWDVEVAALPTNAFSDDGAGNRLGPLGEALDRAFYPTQNIEAIARVSVSNPRRTEIAELDANGRPRSPGAYQVLGADDVFLEENAIELQSRAVGFETDEDVWNALQSDPRYAVIDGGAVPGINYANVTKARFTLRSLAQGQTTFTPIPLKVTDTASNESRQVLVIGVMKSGPSETYRGLWLNQQAAREAFGSLFSRYYLRLAPDVDAAEAARGIEDSLSRYGVSADSIEDQVAEQQALSTAFFLLIQGFLAIGLGVGLVALAVIALRTVVERRQQIGLMRAIGFTRADVGLSFVLESAFVALLGIANGIWSALLLANRMLASNDFKTAGFEHFYVPWLQIGLMSAGVFVASVLATVIPSRQAASIPPAEALRYE